MAAPDFENENLAAVALVLLHDGWHRIKPGSLEVAPDGDRVRFLAVPPSFAKAWIICAIEHVLAIAFPAGEDDK